MRDHVLNRVNVHLTLNSVCVCVHNAYVGCPRLLAGFFFCAQGASTMCELVR